MVTDKELTAEDILWVNKAISLWLTQIIHAT